MEQKVFISDHIIDILDEPTDPAWPSCGMTLPDGLFSVSSKDTSLKFKRILVTRFKNDASNSELKMFLGFEIKALLVKPDFCHFLICFSYISWTTPYLLNLFFSHRTVSQVLSVSLHVSFEKQFLYGIKWTLLVKSNDFHLTFAENRARTG